MPSEKMSVAASTGSVLRLLGRHVPRRAEQHARIGDALAEDRPAAGRSRKQPGQAEVEHLDVAIGADHQVLGLDVAVDDARGVSGPQRRGHLPDQRQELGEVGARAGQRPQRLPLDPFQDQERPAPVFADAVQGADGRMVQGRGGERLAAEPRQGAGSRAASVGRNFRATIRPSRVSRAL